VLLVFIFPTKKIKVLLVALLKELVALLKELVALLNELVGSHSSNDYCFMQWLEFC